MRPDRIELTLAPRDADILLAWVSGARGSEIAEVYGISRERVRQIWVRTGYSGRRFEGTSRRRPPFTRSFAEASRRNARRRAGETRRRDLVRLRRWKGRMGSDTITGAEIAACLGVTSLQTVARRWTGRPAHVSLDHLDRPLRLAGLKRERIRPRAGRLYSASHPEG